jgi:xanthine dehydrogenase YagS FAD-binding subunit
MINFIYSKASTANSAIDISVKERNAKFIAGGTNLVDLMKRNVESPDRLIDIADLSLRTIDKKGTVLHIGALVSNTEVAENQWVKKDHPLLSSALQAGASPQLRNMATVGGNMMQRTRCSYFYDTAMPCNKREPGTGCGALKGYNRMHAIFGASDNCIAVHPSDMCVALAALDTTVIIQGAKQERRIPFTDFHRLPGITPDKDNNLQKGELITGIEIAPNNFGANVHYLKIRDRSSYAFALVSVAAALEISNNTIMHARLAMGGVAHKPWRLAEAEKFLEGKKATVASFHEASILAMNGAKEYGQNHYKLKLAPATITEALKQAAKI